MSVQSIVECRLAKENNKMNYFIHLLLEVSQVHLTRIQKRSKKNTSGTNLKKHLQTQTIQKY
jgi:hypothetical protein